MKIDKTNKPATPATVSNTGRAGGKGRASQTGSQQSGTNVSLGSTAQHLQTMEASMAGAPVVDSAKVAEVKLALEEGRFKVNSEVVADRLIETTSELMKKG